MLPNRFTEPDFPRQASDVKWRKTTEEGENRKEDRIGEMGLREEGGDTGKKQWNTKVKTEPRVTQIFINNNYLSFPYNSLFIEYGKGE